VEYGADNPVSEECGSGFPTEKTQHLFPGDEVGYFSSSSLCWSLLLAVCHK